jgi:hypothetical protein
VKRSSVGLSASAADVRSSSRRDDAAAPPHLGDPGDVEVVALPVRHAVLAGRPHQIEAFGERLHQAVLDAVVDHLHEVAGASRPQCR